MCVLCVFVHTHTHTHIYIYIYIYTCMYICVYIFVNIYMYTQHTVLFYIKGSNVNLSNVCVCLIFLSFLQNVAIRHQSVFPCHVCSNIATYYDVNEYIWKLARSVTVVRFWTCPCWNTKMEERGQANIWLQSGSRSFLFSIAFWAIQIECCSFSSGKAARASKWPLATILPPRLRIPSAVPSMPPICPRSMGLRQGSRMRSTEIIADLQDDSYISRISTILVLYFTVRK